MNAVEISIFNNLLASLCEEMGVALGRSAFSPNIKDRRDYSCALFDKEGRLVGQACHIPVHLGAMAYAVAEVIKEFPLEEGDMLLLNSPFRGGTHLPDVTLLAPVHYQSQLVAYVANRAHHADIGGTAPGSMPLARHIDEEGLIIEPTLLLKGGKLQEEFLSEIKEAVRTPAEREGDLRAQVAAASTGIGRTISLVERYGLDTIQEAFSALFDTGRKYMEMAIEKIPDGVYTFTDQLDGDGIEARPIDVTVEIDIKGSRAKVDFSGSAKPCAGNLNAPVSVTASAVLYAFRCLLPIDCPSNGGLLEPIDLFVPENSLLHAAWPSAVAAGNVETSQRVVDVVLGALSKALPERIPAASCGSMNNVAIGGADFAYYETVAGGAGAHHQCDGRSAIHTHMTNTLNTPIESLESHYPLRMKSYSIRQGSGGKGLHRGGDGVIRELQCLVDCEVSLLTERREIAPYGLAGGQAGKCGKNSVIRESGSEEDLPGKGSFSLKKDEILRIETPGGGGYGRE